MPFEGVRVLLRPCRIQGGGLRKKQADRVTDDELFTRLLYYGIGQLHFTQEEVWLMPLGLLLDLWTCHKQFMGDRKAEGGTIYR